VGAGASEEAGPEGVADADAARAPAPAGAGVLTASEFAGASR
jgi:hypothetical protein